MSTTPIQTPVTQRPTKSAASTLSQDAIDQIGGQLDASGTVTDETGQTTPSSSSSRKMTRRISASRLLAKTSSSSSLLRTSSKGMRNNNNKNDEDNDNDVDSDEADETVPLTESAVPTDTVLDVTDDDDTNNNHDDDDAQLSNREPNGSAATRNGTFEPLEIDDGGGGDEDNNDTGDLEALLDNKASSLDATTTTTTTPSSSGGCCSSFCGPPLQLGNARVVCRSLHERTGFGVVGVHWFGPPAVGAIIAWASTYFIQRALHRIGPISAGICGCFAILTTYLLISTAYRDPGFVRPGAEPTGDVSKWRWCDLCQ